jgi:GTP pyrophosphokinase
MHNQAEYGIAAHWAYADVKKKAKVHDDDLVKFGVTAKKDKLKWVKELANWQGEIVDSDEFLKAVKFDALSERIYVFSPKGDVYDLPLHATPIDFAYAVHTGLGNYIKRVRVNGKQVALNKKLHNGDVVEIIKSKNAQKPSHSWIDYVMTTRAKRKIKSQLRLTN